MSGETDDAKYRRANAVLGEGNELNDRGDLAF